MPSVTSDQQAEGVPCACWRNLAVLLETFPCVSDQHLSQNCHFFYDPLHVGSTHHFKMFWRRTHRKDSPQRPLDSAWDRLPRASGRLWCVFQVCALFSYGRLTIDTPSPSCRIAPSNCIASTGLVRQKVYPRAWPGHDRRRPPESYPDVPGTWRVSFRVLSAGLGTGARADGLPG